MTHVKSVSGRREDCSRDCRGPRLPSMAAWKAAVPNASPAVPTADEPQTDCPSQTGEAHHSGRLSSPAERKTWETLSYSVAAGCPGSLCAWNKHCRQCVDEYRGSITPAFRSHFINKSGVLHSMGSKIALWSPTCPSFCMSVHRSRTSEPHWPAACAHAWAYCPATELRRLSGLPGKEIIFKERVKKMTCSWPHNVITVKTVAKRHGINTF